MPSHIDSPGLGGSAGLGNDGPTAWRSSSDVNGLRSTARVHRARPRDDYDDYMEERVSGTPGFFMTGGRQDGGYDLEPLLTVLEGAD